MTPTPKRRTGRPVTTGETPQGQRRAKSIKALQAAGGRIIQTVRLNAEQCDHLALISTTLPGCRDIGYTVRQALAWTTASVSPNFTPEIRASRISEGRKKLWPNDKT